MSSAVRRVLEEYLAGRGGADRVVIAAAVAYYGETQGGVREALRPLIDVIDRASPGIVELGSTTGASGFEVRLAERPFPEDYEAELRRAAEGALGGLVLEPTAEAAAVARASPLGRIRRMLGALGRLFRA